METRKEGWLDYRCRKCQGQFETGPWNLKGKLWKDLESSEMARTAFHNCIGNQGRGLGDLTGSREEVG